MKNKINVNISPNPLDLQTLHCSQNDTGERKFYFTLHNNGEVIDTTDISDPIFEPFNVYKGGTEQLLPVNTDDPSTSPIIADIQYPDEEKTEQEFTYRESPTTIDGKALIEKIKGNTIVWNQLNANINKRKEYTSTSTSWAIRNIQDPFNFVVGHKYYFVIDANIQGGVYRMRYPFVSTETSKSINIIHEITVSDTLQFAIQHKNDSVAETTYVLDNIQVFDLTLMFGSTKADEIYAMEQSQSGSGVAYFHSLFSLPYYQYDAGSLLSFNGTGIKTTNRNVLDINRLSGATGITVTDGVATGNAASFYTATNGNVGWSNILFKPNTTYFVRAKFTVGNTTWMRVRVKYTDGTYGNGNQVATGTTGVSSWLSNSNKTIENIIFEYGSQGNNPITVEELCCYETSTGETEYIPYESITTSIPTLTYFPTGTKSAGSVYDELSNSKAITRVGEVDLGTLNWERLQSGSAYYFRSLTPLENVKGNSTSAFNGITTLPYTLTGSDGLSDRNNQMAVGGASGKVFIRDDNYSTAEALKTAMDGVMLQYELATEEVTEFTHASLICEDGESALYQDDDLMVCECTEDISKDSGFKDCKIKLTNDDGVVYSNKIQLHIERKP